MISCNAANIDISFKETYNNVYSFPETNKEKYK